MWLSINPGVPLVSLIAGLTSIPLVGAQTADPFIDTPSQVTHCGKVSLSFGGTHPPFFITVRPGGHPELPALETLPGTSGTSVAWLVNLPPGSYALLIRDSIGVMNPSAPFSIQHGSSTCFPAGIPAPAAAPTNFTFETEGVSQGSAWQVPTRTSEASTLIESTAASYEATTRTAEVPTLTASELPSYDASSLYEAATSYLVASSQLPTSDTAIWMTSPEQATLTTWSTTALETSISTPPTSNKATKPIGPIVGGIVCGLVALALLLVFIWRRRGHRARPQVDLAEGAEDCADGRCALDDGAQELNASGLGRREGESPIPHSSTDGSPQILAGDFNPYDLVHKMSEDEATGIVGRSSPPLNALHIMPNVLQTPPSIDAGSASPTRETKSLSSLLPPSPQSTESIVPSNPPPSGSLANPVISSYNRLSIAQLATIQSLVDRNIQGPNLEAVISSMLAAGPAELMEPHDGRVSPAPPEYDFKGDQR